MRKTSLSLLIVALGLGEAAMAQNEPVLDGKLDYRARENTNRVDNDVFTLDLGYTRFADNGDGSERAFRIEGFGGFHNNTPFVGTRFQLFEQTAIHQYGGALSLDTIIGENSGADIGIFAARFWDKWSLHGHAAVQYVSSDSPTNTRNIAPIATVRALYYPWDTTAFSLGASIDGDDPLVHVGVEYQQAGAHNGIFFEWVLAVDGYREEEFYNTLRIGLRASSFEGLLKAQHRKTGVISYARHLDSR